MTFGDLPFLYARTSPGDMRFKRPLGFLGATFGRYTTFRRKGKTVSHISGISKGMHTNVGGFLWDCQNRNFPDMFLRSRKGDFMAMSSIFWKARRDKSSHLRDLSGNGSGAKVSLGVKRGNLILWSDVNWDDLSWRHKKDPYPRILDYQWEYVPM